MATFNAMKLKDTAAEKAIKILTYEIQTSEGMELNAQSIFYINSICNALENTANLKNNEIGIWMNANPEATVKEVKVMMHQLELGTCIRGKRWIDFVKKDPIHEY